VKKKPYKYAEWIKHANDFLSDDEIIVYEGGTDRVSIKVHPAHKHVLLNVNEDTIKQVFQLPKSLQLYFFDLVWVGFCDFKSLEGWGAVRKILIDVFEYAKSKPAFNSREMIWDDHALSERACALLYVKEVIDDEFLLLKIDEHLKSLTKNLDILVSSDKWRRNNHRIFHLCAKYCLEKVYRKNKISSNKFLLEIEKFFLELIDLETGVAVEQSIAYYNFDIILLELVSNFVSAIGDNFIDNRLNIKDIVKKKGRHMSALAFPDGEFPASGDTPIGLKGGAPSLTSKDRKLLWKGLERIGHFRGASENDRFHYHILSHNAESSHGHYSPLHVDLWIQDMGMVLVDSGGPYKYGDSLRYQWFRTSLAHNTITFSDAEPNPVHEKVFVSNKFTSLEGAYLADKSCFTRDVITYDNSFNLKDKIISSSDWSLCFHFAPEIRLEKLKGNSFQVFKGEASIVLNIVTNADIKIENVERFVTSGTGLKELSPSLILTSNAGLFEVVSEFSFLG
jgi:hypothetical protein